MFFFFVWLRLVKRRSDSKCLPLSSEKKPPCWCRLAWRSNQLPLRVRISQSTADEWDVCCAAAAVAAKEPRVRRKGSATATMSELCAYIHAVEESVHQTRSPAVPVLSSGLLDDFVLSKNQNVTTTVSRLCRTRACRRWKVTRAFFFSVSCCIIKRSRRIFFHCSPRSRRECARHSH